jgi:23S rRNA pseudouridine1911/1915/1917 synthase
LRISLVSTVNLKVDNPGTRLDKYITEHCPDISRTQAQRIIEEGRVTVNGNPARPSLKLNTGDSITFELPPPVPSSLTPEAIPIKIVYEDDNLLVVDKPAGLAVHPAPGHPTHTLANAILSHLPKLDTGDWQRPGIVHRLDKDTSGLIIVAKNSRTHQSLMEQFKKRQVSKVYLALVNGHLTPDEGIIEAPIGRDRSHRERMAVTDSTHGREARTVYRVLEYLGRYSLLEVKPETGRTHQIRVHLEAIGYPVVGDKVYGIKSQLLDRQFLHAHRIRFKLPSNGKEVEFESDLPPDLADVLKRLKSTYLPGHDGL